MPLPYPFSRLWLTPCRCGCQLQHARDMLFGAQGLAKFIASEPRQWQIKIRGLAFRRTAEVGMCFKHAERSKVLRLGIFAFQRLACVTRVLVLGGGDEAAMRDLEKSKKKGRAREEKVTPLCAPALPPRNENPRRLLVLSCQGSSFSER